MTTEDKPCSIHIKKGTSFQDIIYEHVIVNKYNILSVFLDLSDDKSFFVYSISFNISQRNELISNEEIRFDITDVFYHEEGNSYHNVCFSEKHAIAIYNYTNDTFDRDIYLQDKYGDFADLYISNAISNVMDAEY